MRDVATDPDVAGIPFVGTPARVADEMAEAMAQIGGDGFIFAGPLSRRTITEIADGLVPALQRRDRIRTRYGDATMRENLMAF